MPGIVIAWELIPLGWIGGDTAAVLPGLKLGTPFFLLVLMWTKHMSWSYHLISQADWNRCNLLYSALLHPSPGGLHAVFGLVVFFRPLWPIKTNAVQNWPFLAKMRRAELPLMVTRNKLVKSLQPLWH